MLAKFLKDCAISVGQQDSIQRVAVWCALVAILGVHLGFVSVPPLPAETSADQAKIAKHLEAGKKALRNGNYEKAVQSFAIADELSGGSSTTACLGLGAAHLQASDFDEAILQAERAVTVAAHPHDQAVAYNLLGTALLKRYKATQGEEREAGLKGAETALKKALDLTAGELSIAWSNLALVLERRGEYAEAESALEEYLERNPNNESARKRLSQLRDKREWQETRQRADGMRSEGRVAEAATLIEEYLKRFPEHGDANFELCLLQNYWLNDSGSVVGNTGTRVKKEEYPVRMEGEVEPPVKLSAPSPQYTEEARMARIQGVVIIEAMIDREGEIQCARILKDLPLDLGTSAVNAVKTWRFKPATIKGEPVNVFYNLSVNFRLGKQKKR